MQNKFTRRKFLQTSALAAAGVSSPSWQSRVHAQASTPALTAPLPSIAPGPFKGTRESLAAYNMPDWFADAKLGMWNHWGPQSAAEYGDWYARRMYVQGEPQYQHHIEHYGHPSKSGFVDVIKSWKPDRFDADYLMSLYQKA